MKTQPRRNSLQDLQMVLSQKIQPMSMGESPLKELQIKCEGKEDLEEVKYILGDILDYPSTQLAKFHKYCNRLGTYDLREDYVKDKQCSTSQQHSEDKQYCSCCSYLKQQYPLSLCTDMQVVDNFGIPSYFYFLTLKHLTLLIMIMIIAYSIFALATNIIASGRYNPENLDEIFHSNIDVVSLALGSKLLDDEGQNGTENKLFYLLQCWIGVILVVIFGLLFIVIKNRQKKIQFAIGDDTRSASDYSITMQEVPQIFTKSDMQEQFDRYYKEISEKSEFSIRPFQIVKYNVAKPFYLDQSQFDNEQINSLNEKDLKMIQMFINWIQERKKTNQFQVPKEQRQAYYKEYKDLLAKRIEAYQKVTKQILKQFEETSKNPTTTVFVTFTSNCTKKIILSENSDGLGSKFKNILTCGKGTNKFELINKKEQVISKVRIRQAPEPQDVIWTNLGQTSSQSFKRKAISFLCTLVMLGISFTCVYFLSYAQIQNPDNSYLSLLISLTISIVNIIIRYVLRVLTVLERDFCKTNHQASLGFKVVLALLVNSIVIPILANQIMKEHNIYGVNGLAYDIFLLGITNSFLQPILKIFDMYYYYTRVMAWWMNRPSQKLYLNQHDLNVYNEYIEFQTGYEYIFFVHLFLFTCFFVSLQPIISVFALLGMIIMYWSQKYSVYSRSKRPVPGTTTVNTTMYQLIYLGPFLFSFGNFIWSHILNQSQLYDANPQTLIPNIIAIVLSCIIFLIPYGVIVNRGEEFDAQRLYEQNKIYLPAEYDRLNPNTSKQAIEQYIKFIEDYREKVLKHKSPEEKKKIQMIFVKQMGRGHHNPQSILPPILGGPQQGQFKFIQQIFAPLAQDLNPLLINKALFEDNKNPVIPIQNWEKSDKNNMKQEEVQKVTESAQQIRKDWNAIEHELEDERKDRKNAPNIKDMQGKKNGPSGQLSQLFSNQKSELPQDKKESKEQGQDILKSNNNSLEKIKEGQ